MFFDGILGSHTYDIQRNQQSAGPGLFHTGVGKEKRIEHPYFAAAFQKTDRVFHSKSDHNLPDRIREKTVTEHLFICL